MEFRARSRISIFTHTARSLKGMNARLRVGGPATAAAAWVGDFLTYTHENQVPVDFVSTHGYADDTVKNLFGTNEEIPMDDRVCRAVTKVHDEITASATPRLPLMWSEWNVEGMNDSRDTTFVGPALANTIRACDGHVDMLSLWTFSDVFEEGGSIAKPFEGQFGLRAKGGINKSSYYAYGLLHELGDQRIAVSSNDVLVTRGKGGDLSIAAWNLVDPGTHGTSRTVSFNFIHVPKNANVTVQRVDDEHGNVLRKYAAMGSPPDPTPTQVEQLNRETALPAPEESKFRDRKLQLTLTPNALVLIRVQAAPTNR
jgi:xylan 1,4-beta-xylosidase